MEKTENKVALITGASSGTAKATAGPLQDARFITVAGALG